MKELAAHQRWFAAGPFTLWSLDVESKGAHVFASVVGGLLRTPRWHPNPVEAPFIDHGFNRTTNLILDHICERAGCCGECHIDDESAVLGVIQTVEEAEVNDVNAQFGVDNIFEGFLNVFKWCLCNSFGHGPS